MHGAVRRWWLANRQKACSTRQSAGPRTWLKCPRKEQDSIRLLWRYFVGPNKPELFDAFLPLVVLLIVLVMLHILIVLLLPLRWPAIRGEFHRQLEGRLQTELASAYAPIPGDVAEALNGERRQVQQFLGEVREVAAWLGQREQAASIAGLYGD